MRAALALALGLAGCSLSYGTAFLCGPLPDGGNLGTCAAALSCVSGVCQAAGGGTSGGGTTGSRTTGGGGQSTGGSSGTTTGGTQPRCGDGGLFIPVDGGTMFVDDVIGDDRSGSGGICCGTPTVPCNSLTFALNAIADAHAQGVTIEANDHADAGRVWQPVNGEQLPLRLINGVILHAPGLYFQESLSTHYFLSINGALAGDPLNPIRIGFLPLPDGGHDATATKATPLVVLGPTRLQNAAVAADYDQLPNGLETDPGCIDVIDGGQLTLGPGPVHLGGRTTLMTSLYGLLCRGPGASIADDPDGGPDTVLTVEGQYHDVRIERGCSATLTAAPVFGIPPGPAGCNWVIARDGNPLDYVGLDVYTASGDQVVVRGGLFQCHYNYGVAMASDAGASLSLQNTTILHSGCQGLALQSAGQVDLENCTIRDTQEGIWWIAGSGTVLVDGGSVVCIQTTEPGLCTGAQGEAPIDIFNEASGQLVVNHVTLDSLSNFLLPFLGDGGFPDGGTTAVEAFDGGVSLLDPLHYAGTCP